MDNTHEEVCESMNEQSPLLGHERVVQQGDETQSGRPSFASRSILFCATLIITASLVEMIFLFQMLATNQILEDIICSRIETSDRGDRIDCGNNADVQAEIAQLRGWQVTLDFIPGETRAIFLNLCLFPKAVI